MSKRKPKKPVSRRVRLDWIPLDVSFPRGRKAVALGIATSTPLAWAYVVQLWAWAAENARNGEVTGPDSVAVLEHAAGWTGAPGVLVECMALPHIALLDPLSNGFKIHDWEKHTGKHIVSAQSKAETNAQKQAEWRLRNQLRNQGVTEECPPKKEKEKENLLTTHTLGADARKAGQEAAAAIAADAPGTAPLANAVIKILRGAGRNALHASPEARAAVESAIGGVTPEVAAQRIAAAWNPAKPWLTFYLEAITGRTNKPTTQKRGMAPPSTDFTSPEATTL